MRTGEVVRRWTAATAVGLLAAACSGGAGESTSTSTTEAVETSAPATSAATTVATTTPPVPLQIGIVAPSPEDDGSFTQSLYDALARLDTDAQVGRVLTVAADRDEAREALQEFADDGLDLVIAHGVEFVGALEDVAAANPDVSFATGPDAADPELANVFAYDVRSDEGAFVLGAMASEATGSGAVGVVASVRVPEIQRFVDGFTAGLEYVDPGDVVLDTWLDSFDDGGLAQEAARALVDRGAGALTATSQLSVDAAQVAVERDVPWFGNAVDQAAEAPDQVVASQVYRWEAAFAPMLAAIEAGRTGGERFVLTLADGGIEIAYNDAVAGPALRTVGEETEAALLDGSAVTGVP